MCTWVYMSLCCSYVYIGHVCMCATYDITILLLLLLLAVMVLVLLLLVLLLMMMMIVMMLYIIKHTIQSINASQTRFSVHRINKGRIKQEIVHMYKVTIHESSSC